MNPCLPGKDHLLDYFIVVFDFFLLIVYCGVCKLSSEDTDSNATPSSVDSRKWKE